MNTGTAGGGAAPSPGGGGGVKTTAAAHRGVGLGLLQQELRRAFRVVHRHGHAPQDIERMDARGVEDAREGFDFLHARDEHLEAAGRKLHRAALDAEGEGVILRQRHACALGFARQFKNRVLQQLLERRVVDPRFRRRREMLARIRDVGVQPGEVRFDECDVGGVGRGVGGVKLLEFGARVVQFLLHARLILDVRIKVVAGEAEQTQRDQAPDDDEKISFEPVHVSSGWAV
ncbi:MAG: hypothetical protein HY301_14790 [Verrucomicrobia bacterium]|nr:hypothetical protein [Verrucomicrobiota bacterium]